MDLERFSNFLLTLGKVKSGKKLGTIHVRGKDFTCIIFQTGHFMMKTKSDRKSLEKITKKMYKTVMRALYCVGCGICVSKCSNNAISIVNGKAVINQKSCTHCGEFWGSAPFFFNDSQILLSISHLLPKYALISSQTSFRRRTTSCISISSASLITFFN